MRVVGQLCSQKYKWFQFIIAPLVLYLPFPWEGPASTSLCQDLGIPSPHGIPVLVEEAQFIPPRHHNQLFQEKSSTSGASKGHWMPVPGMLAGVLAVLGTIQQPSAARCAKGDRRHFLGTAACSCWSLGRWFVRTVQEGILLSELQLC